MQTALPHRSPDKFLGAWKCTRRPAALKQCSSKAFAQEFHHQRTLLPFPSYKCVVVPVISLMLFSCPVVSSSLRPQGLQHVAPSLSFTISWSLPASVMPPNDLILRCPLLFLPQSFPASGTFPMSRLFASDDQNTGASASASVVPMGIQG